ncbi:MAG TPA: hypothetical protein VFF28_03845 [Candidatus Nanoarchaeia archaeon]|nr:hypothetical protein [Candidatus Nanoarchaeia archaeon]
MATSTLDKPKKTSIYQRSGLGPLPIHHVERLLHQAGRKVAERDLTSLVDKFWSSHFDDEKGRLKEGMDDESAANAFLKTLGEYHYGPKLYKELIDNGHHEKVKSELVETYGSHVEWDQLRKAFAAGYESRDHLQQSLKTPMVDRAVQTKQQRAQKAIVEYKAQKSTRDELKKHLQMRAGDKDLDDTLLETLDVEYVAPFIERYMNIPGNLEKTEKNAKVKLDIPIEVVGKPDFAKYFKDGKRYVQLAREMEINADSSHRLAPRGKEKTHGKASYN